MSRPALQPVWEKLLKLCHAGMNYGGGQSVRSSGELGALNFASRYFKPNGPIVIFDVGANDGEYIEAARRVISHSDLHIFSFEPQYSCFQALQSSYGDDPHVCLRQAALGKEVGTVDLFFSEAGSSSASLHRVETHAGSRSESVEMTTVDDVCQEKGLEYIDFLKIDTEGHEIDVLLGARLMVQAGRITAIQFEFGDTFLHTNYHFHDIFNMLSPSHTIFRILRSGLIEVPRYTHDLEIFKLANFLCIRKDAVSH
ncbi:MAG TPA: FkbM family methyltransferase [Acidobacteriaceae bacterium]